MKQEDHVRPLPGDRAFAIGFALNAAFVVTEGVFGALAGSLALLADAGHNLSDVAGVALAWTAMRLSRRKPSLRRSYGLGRASILAALANSLLLMAAVGVISWEAVGRLRDTAHVEAGTVMWVAGIGFVINALTALLFARGREKDLNVRAVFVHMSADAAISLGVVGVGLAIRLTGAPWIDPIASLVIAALIAMSAWSILKESFNLAVDAVPSHVDVSGVRDYLEGLPGVTAVHDLHIWPLSTTRTALTAHLLKPQEDGDDELLRKISCDMRDLFSIAHVTIQWERGKETGACPMRDDSQ